MFPPSIKRIILVVVLLAGVAGAALQAAPIARAQGVSPSITATIDAKTYGVMLVAGQNFTPRTTATVEVRDVSSGAVLRSTTMRVDNYGRFVTTVSIAVISGKPLVTRVTIRAIDASQAVTEDLLVTLSTPVELVQQQVAGVQQGLADALAAVQQRLAGVTQAERQLAAAQQQLVAAQQALLVAQANHAAPNVIAALQYAVDLAQQQVQAAEQAFATAQQALATALAVLYRLEAATVELQQELGQAQAAAAAS